MAGKSNLELKLGVFVFIGLIVLVLAVFSINEIYMFRPGYLIKVVFNFASGVNVGEAVRVAGLQVGEVRDINFTYDENEGRAKVSLLVWIEEGVKIPRDSKAFVDVLGLIGEPYLEIIPGQEAAHLLKEGDVLVGSDPFSTEPLMEALQKAAVQFAEASDTVDRILDEDTQAALKETILNFRDFSKNLTIISGRLERGEGKLGSWLKPKKSRRKKD